MRALVTGSGGFVGSHLCRYLQSLGDTVIECPGPDGPNALDITDGPSVCRRIADSSPDAIIHLAGVSSVAWSHSNPEKTFLINCVGTVNVLEAVRQGAPRCKVLIVGSGEMYGPVSVGKRAHEQDSLRPLSPYAASKCAAEEAARQFASAYDVHAICTRPFNHLGDGQSAQFVVPSFARQIIEIKRNLRVQLEVGDLTPVRDFTHVEDVVRAYRLLLDHAESGATFNICSGQPLSIGELLDTFLSISGVKAEIKVESSRLRPVEIPWLVGDASRIREIGWRPHKTIRQALKAALDEAATR